MKKINDLIVISIFIALFIIIRSINFPLFLNFSTDQAAFSLKSLELWRSKQLILIGPSISFHFIGRDLYQGSLTYYFQLLFLLLGRFDPLKSSYLFMLFSSLMVLPLYFGSLILIGYYGAIFVTTLFVLLPFYIDYSRFFWNPNYQFILTPILILLIGLYKKTKKNSFLFLSGLSGGILLLFHYQFVVIIAFLSGYYLLFKKIGLKGFIIFAGGVILGFSPLIIFELRNNFYNLQTLFLYIKNYKEVIFRKQGGISFSSHYFLSISLFLSMIIGFLLKKHLSKIILILGFVLIIYDLALYTKKPTNAFGMADHWNYLMEEKVNQFIQNERLQNFNIVNLEYDTNATVQKYLIEKNNIKGISKDYYNNHYLFVINKDDRYMENPAYEVNSFTPSSLVKKWRISNHYWLYLLEKNEK